MSTRAEEAKYNEQRSGAKKAKLAPRPHRKISGTHAGEGFLNRRDRSKSAARKFHARRRAGRMH